MTRHADIPRDGLNPHVFFAAQGIVTDDAPPDTREVFGSMIVMNDPRHRRLRGLISQAFSSGYFRKVDADLRATARRVGDAVIENGGCDFVMNIATPFPMRVICDMMDIPESPHSLVFQRTNILPGRVDSDYGT